jgi:predicted RNase H-like HicB family nuclease
MNKKNTAIDYYLNLPWHYSTEASIWEGEKGYWVAVAELPECSTFAFTIEEGLKIIPALLREYIKVAIVSGVDMPEPRVASKSDIEKPVDKILLRMPISLHMGVKNAAKQERISINQFAVKALTEAVTRTTRPSSQAFTMQRTLAAGKNAKTKKNKR